jgi:hypothetical protein
MPDESASNAWFDLAGQAERAHDHFTLYQVIRELAPKKPIRKIQICNSQGTLLNPVEAADDLQTWFEALYNDAGTQIPATSFQWPFTRNELAEGFHALPLLKALTPESAPAPYWQCAADPIADQLTSYLTSCGERDISRQLVKRHTFLHPKECQETVATQGTQTHYLVGTMQQSMHGHACAENPM